MVEPIARRTGTTAAYYWYRADTLGAARHARQNRVISQLADGSELAVGAPIVVNHAVGGCS
ncbi:MAG TPA: hypothetical protein VGD71_04370 [Kribbella sp.]